MNEQSFDHRAQLWLELGPSQVPVEAVQSVLDAIETVPQERPRPRVAGRALPASRRGLLTAAAAVVLAITAAGAFLLRPEGPNIATPRDPDHLLFEFPDATSFFEGAGGPATAGERITVAGLPRDRAFVVAASCTGGGKMVVDVYSPASIQARPSDGGAAPAAEPMKRLDVVCDGIRAHLNVSTMFTAGEDPYDVVLVLEQGMTWRLAVGEYRSFATQPSFPAVQTTDGWYLLADHGWTQLITGDAGLGIGLYAPERASRVAVLVQCSGDPITLTPSNGSAATDVPCDDPARTTRIEYQREDPFDVTAGSAGLAWVRLAAEANGAMAAPLPTTPPLPPGVGAVGYADTDGQYIAFGTLGSNSQSTVRVPATNIGQSGTQIGIGGGDFVAVTTPDGEAGTRLDLWAISEAATIRTLARTSGPDSINRSFVDATHRQVFYEVAWGGWHRVAFDGSGDVVIAATPAGSLLSDAVLAVDESVFVVDWCPAEGSCTRIIHDAATGDTREVKLAGNRTCRLIGVVDGRVVARSAPTCAEPEPGQTTVQDIDGGPRRVIVDGPTLVASLIVSSAGPGLLYADGGDTRTTYRFVGLDGGEPREVATFEHDLGFTPQLSPVRLPVGDWILLAGPLADTPANQGQGRPVPVLLNVATGDRIELVNLPHSSG